MYTTPSHYEEVYTQIVATSLTHSACKLVLFVSSLSVDALCAARVLATLLRKRLVNFQLVPVVGYSDLLAHYSLLDDDVVNVVLVGCGALVDLERFLEIDVELLVEDGSLRRRIYVMDGHRPWNLDNVFGLQVVTCFDDGMVESDLAKEREAYEYLMSVEDDELEEAEAEAGEEGEEEDTDDDETPRLPSKRGIISSHESTIENYYASGSSVTTSVASQVYLLVSLVGETLNVDNLWLSIVGLASLEQQYPALWERLTPLFKDEVRRLNHNQEERPSLEAKADSFKLLAGPDYRLFLLRHWLLYNAFYFSNYINLKLLLYTEQGKLRLNKMFAKMGISLQTAQQRWLYMDIGVKKKLDLLFSKVLVDQYGFDRLQRQGFFRLFGFNGSISAHDTVEAVFALLEHDASGTVDDGEEDVSRLVAARERLWIANFWKAWDALGSLRDIQRGVELAQLLQQLIFQVGHSVIEKRQLKNLKLFRLVVLNTSDFHLSNTSARDSLLHTNTTAAAGGTRFFSNPLNLLKLGHWLLDTVAEVDRKVLPLVLASLDEHTDTYLVVGMAPKVADGAAPEVNMFSVAFQRVANETGVKVRIDSFESLVIEIRKGDLAGFLERLTLGGVL